MQIAIDGPSGAGKSTIAKKLAKKLNLDYLDTGAMYRTLAIYFNRNKFSDFDDEIKLQDFIEDVELNVKGDRFYLFNEDVTDLIRTEEIGMLASKISSFRIIREFLVAKQQNIAKGRDIIMDGRDVGTVILKNADYKIYLTASLDERTKRRCNDLRLRNIKTEFEEVKTALLKRDYDDINREHSPLKKADDAIEIDSSFYSIEETIEIIMDLIKKDGDKRNVL